MVSYVCNNIVLATAMPFNGSINLTDMKYRSLSWSYGYEISVPLLILWLWNFSDSIDLMAMKFQCLCETYGCGISMPLWTLWVWNFSASIDLMAMNSVPLLMIFMGMFSAFNVLMGYGYYFSKFLCLDSTLIMDALKKWHWNVGMLLIVFTNKSVMHVCY